MRVYFIAATGLALAGLLAGGTPACAASNRAWVSGHGVDEAGCGAPAAPCRSLQYAHDHAVNAGGEIDILDPAGYGALSITRAISVVNDGVGTAGVQAASGSAISIAAGQSDAVYLKGLNVDGLNGGGLYGIDFVSGQRLVVDHCVVRHFAGYGINIAPTAGPMTFEIRDTVLSDNQYGFVVDSSVITFGLFDHVSADGNSFAGGATIAGGSFGVDVTVTNSEASNNGIYGLAVDGVHAFLEVSNSTLSANGSYGAWALVGGSMHIARSVIAFNQNVGLYAPPGSPDGGGAIISTGDNHIEANNGPATSGNVSRDSLQ